VFGDRRGGLNRVPAAGGEAVQITRPAPGQSDHRFPSFLPDGHHFLFYVNGGLPGAEASGVYLGSIDSPDVRRIAGTETGAVYSAGHLLFVRQSTLLAQPFNLKTFDVFGDPTPVADQVTRNYAGIMAFSVSDGGALAYGIGPSQSGAGTRMELTWRDRQGKTLETIGSPGMYRGLDLSPDGKRVAVHRHEGNGGDIWILDGARTERFTFDPGAENESPLWSPDGRWIAFAARRGQKSGLYRKPSNNAGSEETLIELDAAPVPEAWTPDSESIIYRTGRDPGATVDLFMLPLTGARKPLPAVNTPALELHAQVSPDGRWLAYQAAENSGNVRPEIYVRPITGGGKYQVSVNGGIDPRWRADGRELFYLETTGGGPGAAAGNVVAVDIGPSRTSFERGAPHPLFDSQYVALPHPPGTSYHAYAVSPDGQRFLLPRRQSVFTDDLSGAPVAVVLNWATALQRK
jgi:dipeptidyl aminopeptidase/acylaminoacyl peptidase